MQSHVDIELDGFLCESNLHSEIRVNTIRLRFQTPMR